MPSLQLGHQCCKWVCRECVPNRHNLLCSCLEAFPKPSRKSTSRDLNLLLCTDAILRDPPRCLLHRLHERYVLSALAGYHSCFRMISEKTISLWQSEFVILSNHLGCLQNFSRWQRFVDKCFVSQVISFSATVAILINWTYDRVCQDWKYCLSIQWVLLSELTAAFIVLEMKRGWCECVYALIRRKWWRQRKGLGREAGEEERGYKGAMIRCLAHYLAGSDKTLRCLKCPPLPWVPCVAHNDLQVVPEILRTLGHGHWLSSSSDPLQQTWGGSQGLSTPIPTHAATRECSRYVPKLTRAGKDDIPLLLWMKTTSAWPIVTNQESSRVTSRKRGLGGSKSFIKSSSLSLKALQIWPNLSHPFSSLFSASLSLRVGKPWSVNRALRTFEKCLLFLRRPKKATHTRKFSEAPWLGFQEDPLWESHILSPEYAF